MPIDYDYFDFQGRNFLKIIGRDEKNKRVCIIDSFEPYFWAVLKPAVSEKRIKELQKEIEKIKLEDIERKTRVEKTEVHEKNFLGRKVRAIKIFITNYKDAHAVADKLDFEEIECRREYDLHLITKYIIDKKITPFSWFKVSGEMLNNSLEFGGIDSILEVDVCLKVESFELEKTDKDKEEKKDEKINPKILAFDIEADEFEIGKGEVLMISLVTENFQKVLTWKKCPNPPEFVETFKDEGTMLEKFVEYTKKLNPDLLIGYFSDGFDLPYLRARADINKVKLSLGLDGKQPVFSRGKYPSARVSGIVHVDLFRFIETAYSQYLQSETLGLNEVASELLDETKLEFEFKHSSKIEGDAWIDYFKYNLQDSALTYKLAEKIWPDLLEFSKVIQEPLYEVTRAGMSQLVELYIIHNLQEYNEIAEKRPLNDEISLRREREKYEGAFVFQPTPGLYENLAMFDFTSYWPSIIVTYNLSRSTFMKDEIEIQNISKESNVLKVDIDEKTFYFSKKPGFFSWMLNDIIEKRKKYKKEYQKNPSPLTKARSNAYKLLANASYGYQGFFGARYYCPEASASTTAISRDLTKKTIDLINKEGYEVLYSDTDSIAFKMNKHTKEEALKLLDKINKNLPGIIELDLEDFFVRGIWVTKRTGDFGAKKKYALLSEKGKLKIRGFETVRRDWCALARELQDEVLEMILKEGKADNAFKLVKETIDKLRKRKIPKQELKIKTQLKKPIEEYKSISPHVTIAKKMLEQGLPVDVGMLIEFYIAEPKLHSKSKNLVRDRAKLMTESGEYDIDYYTDHQILPAVENIFQVFNISVDDLKGKKQKSLGEF